MSEEKERRLWRSGNKLETGARNGLFTIGPKIHERYSTSLINENMPMKTTDTVFPYQMDYKYKSDNIKCLVMMQGEGNSHILLVGVQIAMY